MVAFASCVAVGLLAAVTGLEGIVVGGLLSAILIALVVADVRAFAPKNAPVESA
jgi:hypothetical protein